MRVLSLLSLIALMMAASPAAAQQNQWPNLGNNPQMEAIGEDDVALVVAIEEYIFLPDVDGAIETANDWENFFRRGLGLSSVQVVTNRDASREGILRFARQAAEDVGPNGNLWFVFVGHGSPMSGGEDGGLVGMDAQQTVESLEARSLSQGELLDVLESGAQARTIVVVDACFSGRAGDGTALAEGVQPVIPVNVQPREESRLLVMTAARADQYAGALPGKRRPAFSYLLLGALRGWATDGDQVTAGEAILYVQQQLRGVPGRQQTPELFGTGEIVLTRGVVERDPTSTPEIRRPVRTPEYPPEYFTDEAPEEVEAFEPPTPTAQPELREYPPARTPREGSTARGFTWLGIGTGLAAAAITGIVFGGRMMSDSDMQRQTNGESLLIGSVVVLTAAPLPIIVGGRELSRVRQHRRLDEELRSPEPGATVGLQFSGDGPRLVLQGRF